FDIAFEGVCSFRDIEMPIKPLSDKEIKDNMGDLKKKLVESTTSHAEEIHKKDAIANQVISNDSDLVKNLEKSAHQSFMKLLLNIQPVVSEIIQEKCDSFVENFSINNLNELLLKLSHNKTWKESEEDLVEISGEILNTL
ncbi:4177_t:CDS:2, partial [Funneliformis geosporum]